MWKEGEASRQTGVGTDTNLLPVMITYVGIMWCEYIYSAPSKLETPQMYTQVNDKGHIWRNSYDETCSITLTWQHDRPSLTMRMNFLVSSLYNIQYSVLYFNANISINACSLSSIGWGRKLLICDFLKRHLTKCWIWLEKWYNLI